MLLLLIVTAIFSKGTFGSRQQSGINSAIESVLQQDATTTAGVNSVEEIVSRMRAIDISGCPNDFRSAYIDHVHAWEAMANVEQQAIQLKNESNSAGAYVEAFVRGFMLDPFGKSNEEMQAQNQLQREANSAKQQIIQTWNQVEGVAVANGAILPKR